MRDNQFKGVVQTGYNSKGLNGPIGVAIYENTPVSEFQISNSILSGDINAFTYLWEPEMAEWAVAKIFSRISKFT